MIKSPGRIYLCTSLVKNPDHRILQLFKPSRPCDDPEVIGIISVGGKTSRDIQFDKGILENNDPLLCIAPYFTIVKLNEHILGLKHRVNRIQMVILNSAYGLLVFFDRSPS